MVRAFLALFSGNPISISIVMSSCLTIAAAAVGLFVVLTFVEKKEESDSTSYLFRPDFLKPRTRYALEKLESDSNGNANLQAAIEFCQ